MVDSIKQNSPDRALKAFLKIFAKIIEETPMAPSFFNKIAACSLEKGLHKFFSGGRGDFEKLETLPLRKEKQEYCPFLSSANKYAHTHPKITV